MPPTNPIQMDTVPPILPPSHKKLMLLIAGGVVLLLVAGFLFVSKNSPSNRPGNDSPVVTEYATSTGSVHYLAFQLFTDIDSKLQNQNYPPLQESVKDTVNSIVKAVGTVGSANKKLGFIVGPIAFDMTDDQVRQRIRDSFAVALETNTAVGFHVDDSMFWGRLSSLNTIKNIEWLDWNKTPNTGRRLDWSSTPTKIMPQLCVNSPAVVAEIKKRAALIGEEVKKGIGTLKAAGKQDLFIGVIAGWEMQMGRDFDTGKYLGYCALTNKGYSAKNPPADIDEARVEITKDFIDLWTRSLANAGVPDAKIYSHIAFMPQINFDAQHASSTYTEAINFAAPRVAFGPHHQPGFSTYPGTFKTADIASELAKNGNPPWISAEGTALDPAQAEAGGAGVSMEGYLGSFFNHGAVMVNVFGWGVGPAGNAFRQVAEGPNAIKAYQKFLGGATLSEDSPNVSSSGGLPDKVHRIQSAAPGWIQGHPDRQSQIQTQFSLLDGYIKKNDLTNANKTADVMLKMMGL